MALTSSRLTVDAIKAVLDAAVTTYLGEGPDDPSGRYCVIYPLAGSYRGTLGNHTQDLELQFQTTSVGETPEQAMWVHDKVATALLPAVTIAPSAGITSLPVRQVIGSQQPALRDEDLPEPMFYITCRWLVTAIPE